MPAYPPEYSESGRVAWTLVTVSSTMIWQDVQAEPS